MHHGLTAIAVPDSVGLRWGMSAHTQGNGASRLFPGLLPAEERPVHFHKAHDACFRQGYLVGQFASTLEHLFHAQNVHGK